VTWRRVIILSATVAAVWLVLILHLEQLPAPLTMGQARGDASLISIGSVDLPAIARDLVVIGDYVFVAADSAGLRVVDVSDPTAPVETAVVEGLVATRVVASRGWLFVVNDGDRSGGTPWVDDILNVLDVTEPAAPIRGAGYELAGETADIDIAADYRLFAAVGRESPHPRDGWLMRTWVLDMRSPLLGHYVGRVEPPGSQLALAGRFLYASTSAPAGGGTSTSTLRVMDASVVPSTSPVGMVELPGQIVDLAVAGEYVYAAGTKQLVVVDVSDPERPIMVTQSTELASVYPLTVAANCLYSGRGVLDISEPELPTERARWPHVVTAVAVDGKHAYVAHDSQLSIFDAVACGAPEPRRVFLPFTSRGE